MKTVEFHEFPDRQQCVRQLADDLVAVLDQALARQARATLLLPGGSSPQPLLPLLAQAALDWSRIDLTPTDERWVAAQAAQSNVRLLRCGLPLAQVLDPRQAATPELAAAGWQEQLRPRLPFAAVLLGMGEDGHFASLFAGMPGLAAALDAAAEPAALPAWAPSEPRQRLSLNLSMLCRTGWLGLLAFGAAKRELIERVARADAQGRELPLHALYHNGLSPLRIYWAP